MALVLRLKLFIVYSMAQIINLKNARKQKTRALKEQKAEQNRIKFGRRKSDKEKIKAIKKLEDKKLEAHKTNNDIKE